MLLAILEKVGGAFPEASFVMVPSSSQDFIKRARLGLFQKFCYSVEQFGTMTKWGRKGFFVR